MSLSVFFVILILICEIAVFYFFKNIKVDTMVGRISLPSAETVRIEPFVTSEGEQQIYLSQGVFCLILNESTSSDLNCQINDEGIEIEGKMRYFLPSNTTLVFYPRLENGALEFPLKEVRVGNVQIPSALAFSPGGFLTKVILAKIPAEGEVQFKEVFLSEGLMTLVLKKNEY